jgi:hypothetical protein
MNESNLAFYNAEIYSKFMPEKNIKCEYQSLFLGCAVQHNQAFVTCYTCIFAHKELMIYWWRGEVRVSIPMVLLQCRTW